jgi:hypothetical protein
VSNVLPHGGAAQVYQLAKTPQIESGDRGGRTQLPEAMHSAQKILLSFLRPKEVFSHRAIPDSLILNPES